MDIKDFTRGYRVIGALAKERITPSEFHTLLQDLGRLASYERVFKNRNRQEIVLQQSSALDAIAGSLDAYAHAPEPIRRAILADELPMVNLLAGVLGDDPETFDLDDVANYAGNQIAVELIVQSEMLMNRIGASYAATEALLSNSVGLQEVLGSDTALAAISSSAGFEYVADTQSVLTQWPLEFLAYALEVATHIGLFFKALLNSSDSMWDSLETVVKVSTNNSALNAIFGNEASRQALMNTPSAIQEIYTTPIAFSTFFNNSTVINYLDSIATKVPNLTAANMGEFASTTFAGEGHQTYYAFSLTNTNDMNHWASDNISYSEYIGYEFSNPQMCYRFGLKFPSFDDFKLGSGDYAYLEGSNSLEGPWSIAGSYDGASHYNQSNIMFYESAQNYIGPKKFWRLRFAMAKNLNYIRAKTIEFYGLKP